MNFLLIVVFFGVSAYTTTFAYTTYLAEPTNPYETIPLEQALEERQVHLGILNGFPVMYEVQVSASTSLQVKLSQRYQSGASPRELALMVVRDSETGGVSEIGRLRPKLESLIIRKDAVYGMTFWDTETITKEVSPGVYRIEVSTPTNEGPYLLTIGESDTPVGYFATLAQIRSVQKVFGLSVISMLKSSYVYYPVGILLLLFLIHRTWRFRKSITHA